ncbi:class I SAM-dependent methyltransferase [Dapis sp. BLCC M172]|uniref:class I SAM-dependent methyltransferase n=1 Tax=Dapis sp. BLCC M172 TaxID=2975281 RepID=UPI003CEA04C8
MFSEDDKQKLPLLTQLFITVQYDITMPSPDYSQQAERYALRELNNTDYLAFRTVAEHRLLRDSFVLDLGCGAGRSSRFLKALGNHVVGADISPEMIAQARKADPKGDYHLLKPSQPLPFVDGHFQVFFSSWMLLEIDNQTDLDLIVREMARIICPSGFGIVVTNTKEFYEGNWLSCLVDFPENELPLHSGQQVKARLLPENIDVTDYFWSDKDYKMAFLQAGLRVKQEFRPLGNSSDPLHWKDEIRIAPYVIYQLEKSL